MAPVSVERLVRELEELKQAVDAGTLKHSEYDQRLARVIRELRQQGLDADRAHVATALDDALRRGVITTAGKEHLEKRLGLTS